MIIQTKEDFEKEIKKDPVVSIMRDFSVIKAHIEWDDDLQKPVYYAEQSPIMTCAASEIYQMYLNLQAFYAENPEYKIFDNIH